MEIFIKKYLYTTFLVSSLGANQFATIEGTVLDRKTKEPLVGANVFIVGTSLGTASSNEGSYRLSNIPEGDYILRASYIGYETKELKINVKSNQISAYDIQLSYKSLQGEEIKVTAQAKGQMGAINKQLKAKSIKNIISSDKIQELPDANAAEAVARVPGVSIKREGGEGNKVVIRGLSPKYNKITVNGVSLASTSGSNRSTDISIKN